MTIRDHFQAGSPQGGGYKLIAVLMLAFVGWVGCEKEVATDDLGAGAVEVAGGRSFRELHDGSHGNLLQAEFGVLQDQYSLGDPTVSFTPLLFPGADTAAAMLVHLLENGDTSEILLPKNTFLQIDNSAQDVLKGEVLGVFTSFDEFYGKRELSARCQTWDPRVKCYKFGNGIFDGIKGFLKALTAGGTSGAGGSSGDGTSIPVFTGTGLGNGPPLGSSNPNGNNPDGSGGGGDGGGTTRRAPFCSSVRDALTLQQLEVLLDNIVQYVDETNITAGKDGANLHGLIQPGCGAMSDYRDFRSCMNRSVACSYGLNEEEFGYALRLTNQSPSLTLADASEAINVCGSDKLELCYAKALRSLIQRKTRFTIPEEYISEMSRSLPIVEAILSGANAGMSDDQLAEHVWRAAQANPPIVLTVSVPDVAAIMQEALILKHKHPNWPRWLTIAGAQWNVNMGRAHTALDLFGLIPGLGEPADLVNGAIYVLEGDPVNATISIAATIPIVGMIGPAGRIVRKVFSFTKKADGTLHHVVWRTLSDGTIEFCERGGTYCRDELRIILGGKVGDGKFAHHIIPVELMKEEVVQRYARLGQFHMNRASNGVLLTSTQHRTGHNLYNAEVRRALNSASSSGMSAGDAIETVIWEVTQHFKNGGSVANFASSL